VPSWTGAWTSPRRSVDLDGAIHPDFFPVAHELARQLRRSPGGAAICVHHRGERVVDLWGGVRDDQGRPWTRDTMAPSCSTTKGVASTLIHVLRDRGLLDYDDRVADHWPEFARAGKSRITIRHVLAHQSGLYHIRQMIDRANRMLDWDHMIHAIERTRPVHPPGARTGYHGLTFGFLVGEIAQRVTGQPFPRLVQDEIARPLGLDGMYIGAPSEVLPRAAQLIWPRLSFLGRRAALPAFLGDGARTGAALLRRMLAPAGVDLDLGSILDALAPRGISAFDFGAHETLQAAIPAAVGLFTARSLASMYSVLAAGGELDDVRLLSPDTFERATELQDRAPGLAVIPFDLRWRLGYHGVATSRGVPRRAFGHFGFGGSGGWADPKRELSVALIVNSGMGTPFGDMRIVRIGGAALACADRRFRRARAREERRAPAREASAPTHAQPVDPAARPAPPVSLVR
jgi:CubicO group peptidase (beta-lactamase class C family)